MESNPGHWSDIVDLNVLCVHFGIITMLYFIVKKVNFPDQRRKSQVNCNLNAEVNVDFSLDD